MVDRKKSVESFLRMLDALEQDRSKVRRFQIFLRDGRKLDLILYEIKEKGGLLLKLINGKKAG